MLQKFWQDDFLQKEKSEGLSGKAKKGRRDDVKKALNQRGIRRANVM